MKTLEIGAEIISNTQSDNKMHVEEITDQVAESLKVSEATRSNAQDSMYSSSDDESSSKAKVFGPVKQPFVMKANAKTDAEIERSISRTPLFMTELPPEDEGQTDGGVIDQDSIEIEALKAIAMEDDTPPLDSAADFKEQGNEHFKARIWTNAKELYGKGIEILVREEQKRRLRAKIMERKRREREGRMRFDGMRDDIPRKSDREEVERILGEKEKWLLEDAEDKAAVAAAAENAEEVKKQLTMLETLYVNRAAAHLELKNYRQVTLDCAAALRINTRNVKALYRSAKALLAVGRIVESDDACTTGLEIEPENKALRVLASEIVARAHQEDEKKRIEKERLNREGRKEILLRTALTARGIKTRKTDKPPEMGDARVKLVPDEESPESMLAFPTVLLYPVDLESDFIKEVREDETLGEHLEYVFPLPWDKKEEYTPDGVEMYVENTATSGLLKVGRKVPLLKVLGSGKTEVVDGVFKVFVVPKHKAERWVKVYKERKMEETLGDN